MPALQQSMQLAQHQILAPQMRQSLGILQATALELQQMARAEIESNPALEEDEPRSAEDREESAEDLGDAGEILRMAQLDDDWRDFSAAGAQGYDAEEGARRSKFFEGATGDESLAEHLQKQFLRLDLDAADRRIATLLTGNLDADGRLVATLEEIADEADVETAAAGRMLGLLQSMDPPGVGARDLSECLRLQLERLGLQDGIAARIVASHLDLLGRKKFAEIASALGVTQEQVREAGGVIAGLNPRPGRVFSGEAARVLLPDAVIEKVGDTYVATLVDERVPHLRISRACRDLLSEAAADSEVRGYLREKIRAGKFLIHSIQQRQQTILAIVREIARRQSAFLDSGVAALVPMTMAQVADAIGMHETTVSRAIAGKTVATPQGIFEMKFFFTTGYRSADGAEVSNTSVKDAIAALIRAEDAGRPLSDRKIEEKLAAGGIEVARRTVAKYREELGFLPSHLRKSF